ncbi:hypothetical protein EVJ50_08435 [Synechococcus sp. RSCCF101]|uniref:DUF6679 family protein n=1 Tax=Synechococcus sp. RSCCF101 TaxID=2511069 RepID=UPI0012472A48|nr:DUF6679 family protein [Synechococcus sp. RSCCF101]QEY33456.1 hypothetical protein EVJ50_08435 [Synechococcus sp. RSCCF101]
MLHRKLYRYCTDKQPVWVFLRDQQRWIEEAEVVELEGDLVTLRYDSDDDEDVQRWEESVRLDSIGAVSIQLASFSRQGRPEELETAENCPDAEQIPSPPEPGSPGDGR